MIEEVRIKDEFFSRSQALSIGLHTTLITALLFPFAAAFNWKTKVPGDPTIVFPVLSPPAEILRKILEGGGGQRELGEATRGRGPDKSPIQIVPPGPFRNPIAKIQAIPTVDVPSDTEIPTVVADRWGDPFAKNFTPHGGPGGPTGYGNTKGRSIGSNEDVEGIGGQARTRRPGYTDPSCSYCPNPTFTEEAVKAKYQARVLLRVLVSAEGRTDRVQVVAGAGMGLDERAMEAVRGWRFRPGRDPAGKPTATTVYIEVNFRQF